MYRIRVIFNSITFMCVSVLIYRKLYKFLVSFDQSNSNNRSVYKTFGNSFLRIVTTPVMNQSIGKTFNELNINTFVMFNKYKLKMNHTLYIYMCENMYYEIREISCGLILKYVFFIYLREIFDLLTIIFNLLHRTEGK